MDRSLKQKINKETQVLNDTLDEMDLIDIFRTFQIQILLSQVHVEHSPGYTISWLTNQTLVNLRKLKSYQASSLTTML